MNALRYAGQPAGGSRSRGQALVEFALVIPIMLVLLIGIFEAGRFMLYLEALNNAAREGARYAIVHGSNAALPSGPLPGDGKCPVAECDLAGEYVKAAVVDAATGLASADELVVHDPVWWFRNDPVPPSPGDPSTGNNFRGNHVTVFVDYDYSPIFRELLGTDLLPTFSISAESSLVINN